MKTGLSYLFFLFSLASFAYSAETVDVPDSCFAEINVINFRTKEPINSAHITITGTDGSVHDLKTNEKGYLKVYLDCQSEYVIIAKEYKHLNKTTHLSFIGAGSLMQAITMELDPLRGCGAELPNIYFSDNDEKLRPESQIALDGYTQVMIENPNLVFNVNCYIHYNEDQSIALKRGEAVKDYLVENGMKGDRLQLIDKGIKPRIIERPFSFFNARDILNEKYVQALPSNQQEEAKQLNRRVEFSVLRYDFVPKIEK